MAVEKNGKTYLVTETQSGWTIKWSGVVSISYKVPKNLCATLEQVRQYILENPMF